MTMTNAGIPKVDVLFEPGEIGRPANWHPHVRILSGALKRAYLITCTAQWA